MTRLMFGDYMDVDLEPEECVYEEVDSLDKMNVCVEAYLKEFNNTNKTKMNLVIFQYVLEHLSHICRILRSPGGHALLVGVGGSGRQSLTRLGSMMAGFSVFQPEISKNYGKGFEKRFMSLFLVVNRNSIRGFVRPSVRQTVFF